MPAASGQLAIQPDLTFTGDTDIGGAPSKFITDALAQMVFGSGGIAADVIVADNRTLAASASETLDLTAIPEALAGKPVALAKVFAVVIAPINDSVFASTLTVGNAASNQFLGPLGAAAHTTSAGPGGAILWLQGAAAGWTVDSTHKSLKISNGDSVNPVTYGIVIVGHS